MNNNTWTGRDVLNLRNELGMKRPQFAELLKISVSTLEKWESDDNADKPVRGKYIDILTNIASSNKGALGKMTSIALLNPLLGPAFITGALVASKFNDEELNRQIELLNELKKLSPDERIKFISLLNKIF